MTPLLPPQTPANNTAAEFTAASAQVAPAAKVSVLRRGLRGLRAMLRGFAVVWIAVGVALLPVVLLEWWLGKRLEASALRLPFPLADEAFVEPAPDFVRFEQEFRTTCLDWRTALQAQPYGGWVNRPFAGEYFNIGSDGWRRTVELAGPNALAPPASKNPVVADAQPGDTVARPRIFLFGGSTAWGYGVRDDYTLASCLTRELAAVGERVEVKNLAQMGYVSSQEVIDLEEQLRPNTALDVAIFFHGFNDVAATVANLRPGVPIAQAAREIEFNVLKHRTPELLGVVLRRSAIGKTLRPFFQRPEQPAVPAQPASTAAAPGSAEALLDQTLSITFANHEIVRLLAARGHFSTLFYWQPTVFEKLRRTPSEQSEAKTNSIAQFIEYSSRRVEEFITGGAAETRPRDTYLLGHAFDDSRWSDAPAFLDACHLNEPGTEWIAKHLAADLKLVLSARREAAAD